jgi:hypothetical protein
VPGTHYSVYLRSPSFVLAVAFHIPREHVPGFSSCCARGDTADLV